MLYSLQYLQAVHDAWLKCHQVVVAEPYHTDLSDPKGYGSGFEIQFQGRRFFLSAGHVLDARNFSDDPDRQDDFVGWEKEDLCGVPMGVNDEPVRQSMSIKLSGIYKFVGAQRQKDAEDVTFPEPVDFCFCESDWKLKGAKTIGFADAKRSVRFAAGEKKTFFTEDQFPDGEPVTDDEFFVIGTILGIDRSGMNMTANHQFHPGLKFQSVIDGDLYLASHEAIDKKSEWSGLSGSPVVKSDGKLLGMLLKVSESDGLIRVMPTREILRIIDQSIRIEKSGIDTHEPFIVVPPGTSIEELKRNPAIIEILAKLRK